jgi:hypothetical protein
VGPEYSGEPTTAKVVGPTRHLIIFSRSGIEGKRRESCSGSRDLLRDGEKRARAILLCIGSWAGRAHVSAAELGTVGVGSVYAVTDTHMRYGFTSVPVHAGSASRPLAVRWGLVELTAATHFYRFRMLPLPC